jgi:hypothetical protein
MTESNKLLTVRMPESLRKEFLEKAEAEGTSGRQLILSWINQYLGKAQANDDGEDSDRVKKLEDRVAAIENQLATLLSSLQDSQKDKDSHEDSLTELSLESTNATNEDEIPITHKEPVKEAFSQDSQEDSQEDSQSDSPETSQGNNSDSSEIAEDSPETSQVDSLNTSQETSLETIQETTPSDSQETSQEGSQEDSLETIQGNSQGDSPEQKLDPFKIEPQPSSEKEYGVKEVKEEESDSKPNYEGLTQKELAARLSRSSTTVKNRIRDKQDERWCRDNDPDGLAWQYDEQWSLYYVVKERDRDSQGAIKSEELKEVNDNDG